MNVLIVVPWDQEFGGVASVVGNVARQLELRGHRVWFFHPGESNSLRETRTKWNFPGYELNLRNPFISEHPVKSVLGFAFYFWSTVIQLRRVLARHDINIVNVHYPIDGCVYFSILRRIMPFKLVVSVHGADLLPQGVPQDTYPVPIKILMNSADWLVAPSQSTRETVLTKFPRLQAKSSAIHNAVDMAEFDLRGRDHPEQGQYVLCVALHQHRKAIDVLIKAFKQFNQACPEADLYLVGDGPSRSELENLVRQLGLESRVKFLGLQGRAAVRTLLREASLVVLPSRVEPFGIAILEALASRKPVVATAVGGIPEIINSGGNGILVEPERPDALAEAMRLVWNDPALSDRLAQAGYDTVVKRFQWEIAGSRYESTFLNLVR
ncbi:MAG: glycosyltransferase family 4 protein [Nitrospirota bacterium]